MNSKKLQLSTRKLNLETYERVFKRCLIQKHKLELTTRIQACIDPYRSRHRKYHLRYLVQHAKKVVSDSSGLVDFAIGLVIFPDGQVLFFGEIQITEGW